MFTPVIYNTGSKCDPRRYLYFDLLPVLLQIILHPYKCNIYLKRKVQSGQMYLAHCDKYAQQAQFLIASINDKMK